MRINTEKPCSLGPRNPPTELWPRVNLRKQKVISCEITGSSDQQCQQRPGVQAELTATDNKLIAESGRHNENHNHHLRNNMLRLLMTRHEYFVQCTKYQLLKLIRETHQDDLNRCTQLNIGQFSAYLKYSIINNHNPLCNLKNCYVCG